jgi:putative Holliday junction resolvase
MPISALGLDIGRRRIGVAGCDGTGLIAFGITTIERQTFPEVLASLRQIADDRKAQVLVIGLPYRMDGTIGTQAKQVQRLAEAIAADLELPIEYVDERLTSVQAEEMLRAEGVSLQHNKALIDRKAAALILQQWLDERRQAVLKSSPPAE